MPGTITDPRAKVWRAAEHQAALDTAIDEWIRRGPVQIVPGENPLDGWFEVKWKELERPPIQLALILADVVNNLESALDHLVYQLVLASGNIPSTGNYVPVVSLEDRWPQAKRSKLKGVRDDWAERFRAFQPFLAPEVQGHPLFLIHFMNKVSKHHIVPVTVVSQFDWTARFQLNRDAQPGEYIEHDLSQLPPPGSAFVDGQTLVRCRARSLLGDLRVVDLIDIPQARVGIAWDVPLTLSGPFPDLFGFVMEVIDAFEDVLGV